MSNAELNEKLLLKPEEFLNENNDDETTKEMSNRLHLTTIIDSVPKYDEKSMKGLNGLRNMGNTCYMNAAIQSLSNCTPFREYFRSFLHHSFLTENFLSKDDLNASSTLTNAFRDVIVKIWSETPVAFFSPIVILVKVREKYVQFRSCGQQDAQEFIRCFLDVLHHELQRPIRQWESDLFKEQYLENNSYVDENVKNSLSNNLCNNKKENDNENENEKETPDSGLSSDTEDAPKSKKKKYANVNADNNSKNNDREKIVNYTSIVTQVFDGELMSSVKCQTCHHVSYTKETFQDISLSIPTAEQSEYLQDATSSFSTADNSNFNKTNDNLKNNIVQSENNSNLALNNVNYGYIYWLYTLSSRWFFKLWYNWFTYFYRCMFTNSVSLKSCLKSFFSTDFLHGDDMYSCEKCAKLRNGAKQCEILRLPEILCIHLKRFRHDNNYNSKINTKVTFPLNDLDLRPFMGQFVLEKNENIVTEYDLVAIISHKGSGIEYGHYVAYCRNEYDNNWYEFDDSIVTRVNAMEVMNREAYVLFYQKKTTEKMYDIKTQCLKMIRQSLKKKTHDIVNLDRYYISKEWLYKLLTFSDPGPINNCNFLCVHSKMSPKIMSKDCFFSTYVYLTENLWKYLKRNFGGGPECHELKKCVQCKNIQDQLLERKRYERKMTTKFELNSVYAEYLPPNVISTSWMEKWKAFVTHSDIEPPPINNEVLVKRFKDGSCKLKPTNNFQRVNRETWLFLHKIYGGGPELFAFPFNQPTAEDVARVIKKINEKLENNSKSCILNDAKLDNEKLSANKILSDDVIVNGGINCQFTEKLKYENWNSEMNIDVDNKLPTLKKVPSKTLFNLLDDTISTVENNKEVDFNTLKTEKTIQIDNSNKAKETSQNLKKTGFLIEEDLPSVINYKQKDDLNT